MDNIVNFSNFQLLSGGINAAYGIALLAKPDLFATKYFNALQQPFVNALVYDSFRICGLMSVGVGVLHLTTAHVTDTTTQSSIALGSAVTTLIGAGTLGYLVQNGRWNTSPVSLISSFGINLLFLGGWSYIAFRLKQQQQQQQSTVEKKI